MAKLNSVVLWRGRSMLDNQPIVLIATGLNASSANAKTGAMVQTWILRDNGEKPHDNVKTGADSSICGDCMHRPANGGACYVKTFQAPRSIYNAYLNNKYEHVSINQAKEILAGRIVRLGAYGDPAAIPFAIWEGILAKVTAWTGYTHQWKRADFDIRLTRYCMLSADSESDAELAKARGLRYFRVKTEDSRKLDREVTCPASEEGGKKLNCETCLSCHGTDGKRKGSIVINVHGALAKRFK